MTDNVININNRQIREKMANGLEAALPELIRAKNRILQQACELSEQIDEIMEEISDLRGGNEQ